MVGGASGRRNFHDTLLGLVGKPLERVSALLSAGSRPRSVGFTVATNRSETVSPPPSFSAGLRQAARDREASEGTIDMTPAIRRHGGTAHAVTAIQSVIAVTRAVQFPQLDGQGSYTNQRFSAPQTVRVTCGCSSSTSVATRRQGS